MHQIELERTFLAKYIPKDLCDFPFKEINDYYIPHKSSHPHIRIRSDGENFALTKKHPLHKNDHSAHVEQTVQLTKEEFLSISKVKSKKLRKLRYRYKYKETIYEIDVFLDALSGLILIDVEFISEDVMRKFAMPDFCLVDITQEIFIAGGKLAGKTYANITKKLEYYNYSSLSFLDCSGNN